MANIFFIKPFISALQEGKSVRFGIFILLWVAALATIIAGIVGWIDEWNLTSGQDAAGVIGVILYQLVFLVFIYMVFQVLVVRASDVLNVEAYDSDFTVIPTMSILIRIAGELIAVYLLFMGIGGLLFKWFGISQYLQMEFQLEMPFNLFWLFEILNQGGFLGGILIFIAGLISAFISIIIAYFWAEAVILGLRLYLDIKKVRMVSDGYDKSIPASKDAPKPPPEDKKE